MSTKINTIAKKVKLIRKDVDGLRTTLAKLTDIVFEGKKKPNFRKLNVKLKAHRNSN